MVVCLDMDGSEKNSIIVDAPILMTAPEGCDVI